MIIESEFGVAADPDHVFAYLVDVERVVSCVPGAQLGETIGPDAYEGRVKVKLGAVVVSYKGTATLLERDAQLRSAILRAAGKEAGGSGGSAEMTVSLSVTPSAGGSIIRLSNDLTITGRAASFGRSIVEDVSRRLIGQMADCIKGKLEAESVSSPAPGETPAVPIRNPAEAKPINGISLLFAVIAGRLRRLVRTRRRAAKPPTGRKLSR